MFDEKFVGWFRFFWVKNGDLCNDEIVDDEEYIYFYMIVFDYMCG